MKPIFKNLNIQLTDIANGSNAIRILIIENRDKSPRWICNAAAKTPLFLKFYAVSSFKSMLFATAIKLIFALRLQKLVFKTKTIHVDKYKEHQPIIDITNTNWAIFTGTIGPNNKLLVFEKVDTATYFYKIANSPQSVSLIENEKNTLEKLSELSPKSFVIPTGKMIQKKVLQLQDISANGERSTILSTAHQKALNEIYTATSQEINAHQLPIYKETIQKLERLEQNDDDRIPLGLINKLRLIANSIEDKKVMVGLSHGDFTPWNMYVKGDKLAIYDWELSSQKIPLGFDAFHFILQQGILVNRNTWAEIKAELKSKIAASLLFQQKNQINFDDYFKFYALINTVYNLNLYTNQPKWHEQIHWMLNTWSEMLNEFMDSAETKRGLLIIDLFDFLNNKNYAAIKFPDSAPNTLSDYSDIDLCIKEKDLKSISNFIEKHALTKKMIIAKKSFMSSVQIILNDGSLLSLDLIWQFKRKWLVMLDAKEILKNASRNIFGVKQMNAEDQAKFVGLFYALNNTKIPDKFLPYNNVLSMNTDGVAQLLHANYTDGSIQKEKIEAVLRQNNENKNIHKIRNKMNYFIDTLKQFSSSKGMIITFSGVDGAGKSTIIENIKYEIEKKLRREVVVIRHRPSLLPILSVWTKGKEKATQDVINSLPRQGGNKSMLSSIFRFGYYYTDYFFGQFYVYFKYILRGKVVLYDRYYFDFINDSKRSNIELPKNIFKIGYKFLLKPDINIFLYANPKVILARKKELKKETIISLTNDYLVLFENLNNKSAKKYIAIENIELRNTLDLIMNEAVLKIAQ